MLLMLFIIFKLTFGLMFWVFSLAFKLAFLPFEMIGWLLTDSYTRQERAAYKKAKRDMGVRKLYAVGRICEDTFQ